jgi:hypothetical protein
MGVRGPLSPPGQPLSRLPIITGQPAFIGRRTQEFVIMNRTDHRTLIVNDSRIAAGVALNGVAPAQLASRSSHQRLTDRLPRRDRGMHNIIGLIASFAIAASVIWSGFHAWRVRNRLLKWGGVGLASLLAVAVSSGRP